MLGGGILTITRRNAVHSAISLIVSLLGVAGLYLLQQAEFLFAVQIVLYVGGIMVLFLFVIMLVNLDQAAKERQFNRQWLVGAGGGGWRWRAEIGYFLYRGQDAFHIAEAGAGARAAGRWGTPRCWPIRCFPNTCCPSRSPRFCCWWRWWARW